MNKENVISTILAVIIVSGILIVLGIFLINNQPFEDHVDKFGDINENFDGDVDNMEINSIKLSIGNYNFTATLEANDAANELILMLPMELDMKELNGNEKYYYLNTKLTVDSYVPSRIAKGDIMLYGDDCLVIFYESHPNTYSYTKIGNIDNIGDLSKALGKGNVKVKFNIN